MFWCLQPPGTIFVWILQSIQTRLSHLEVQTCSHKYYYLLLQKRKGRSIFSYQWSRKLQWFFVIINTQEENGIRQKQTFQTRISFTFFVWLFYPQRFWIFLLKSNSSLKRFSSQHKASQKIQCSFSWRQIPFSLFLSYFFLHEVLLLPDCLSFFYRVA